MRTNIANLNAQEAATCGLVCFSPNQATSSIDATSANVAAPPSEKPMTTYFVATRFRYVLVDAVDESHARELGLPALHDLYADLRERLGKDIPIEIHTIREATPEEIELWNWHHEMLRREERNNNDDN